MKTHEDLLSDLFHNAEQGNHRQFQYLRSWQEYSRARVLRRAEQLLVSSIKKNANKIFKQYVASVAAGESNAIKLFAYNKLTNVLLFYEEELKIISDMIIEYECYLANGNWTDFILCAQRPTDKLWDHRSL